MSSPSDKSLNAQVDRLRLELHELKQEQGALDVRIGDYLLTRLEQLGVRYIFGVPGDFNLGFLVYFSVVTSVDLSLIHSL